MTGKSASPWRLYVPSTKLRTCFAGDTDFPISSWIQNFKYFWLILSKQTDSGKKFPKTADFEKAIEIERLGRWNFYYLGEG
jgi:hypothetical protein